MKRDYLAFALISIAVLLLLPGCASAGGGATWWNPTTWLSRAAPAAADRAAEKRDEASSKADAAERSAVHAAHVEIAKTDLALVGAGEGRAVQLARRTNANALGLLNQVQPLTAEESAAVRQLVADLLSEKAEVVAAAERKQRAAEDQLAAAARDLEEARHKLEQREAALTAANANLRAAYDRENALANQVRNFWFVAGGLALLWLGGTLLGAAARFYPPLAGVSRLVNGIAAPTLAFAEQRASAGLQRVGHALAVARERIPQVAGQITEIFDQHTDADHQRAIGAAASTAPRN